MVTFQEGGASLRTQVTGLLRIMGSHALIAVTQMREHPAEKTT
jgi:hypothetical protein